MLNQKNITPPTKDSSLNGLTKLHQGVAQELAKLKGYLYLNDLSSIDSAPAKELAKFDGELASEWSVFD